MRDNRRIQKHVLIMYSTHSSLIKRKQSHKADVEIQREKLASFQSSAAPNLLLNIQCMGVPLTIFDALNQPTVRTQGGVRVCKSET